MNSLQNSVFSFHWSAPKSGWRNVYTSVWLYMSPPLADDVDAPPLARHLGDVDGAPFTVHGDRAVVERLGCLEETVGATSDFRPPAASTTW